MPRFLSPSLLCTASLLCACAVVRADEAKDKLALAAQPTISLRTTSSSQTNVATFLKTPVSFTVKDASFLGALDAVLSASGKTFPIECRQMKPMKLTFGAREQSMDGVLDTIAKAGGGFLTIFSDKLLLSPVGLLTDEEKASGKAYSVLLFPATPAQGKTLNKQASAADMLVIANMKISALVERETVGSAAGTLVSARVPFSTPNFSVEQRASPERIRSGLGVKDLSLSFQDVPFGEALGMLAHIDACELHILPGKFSSAHPTGLPRSPQTSGEWLFRPFSILIL